MRLALLALLLPLAGCASTTRIDAANPAEIARVQARELGRTADITLTSGDLYRGALVYLRPDSTAWEEEAGVFAVPTVDVRSLVVDTRESAPKLGRAVGAPIGFGLCAVAFASADSGIELSLLFGALCAPVGSLVGVLGGLAVSRRTAYVFVALPNDATQDAAPADDIPAGDGE